MPPNGWLKLHPGDALIMQGVVPTIGSLLKSPDFQFMEEVKIGEKTLRSLDLITVEALLSPNSRYTGYSGNPGSLQIHKSSIRPGQ